MKKADIKEAVSTVLQEVEETLEKMKKYSNKKIETLKDFAETNNSLSDEAFADRIRLLENMKRYHTSKIVELYDMIEQIKSLDGINNGRETK